MRGTDREVPFLRDLARTYVNTVHSANTILARGVEWRGAARRGRTCRRSIKENREPAAIGFDKPTFRHCTRQGKHPSNNPGRCTLHSASARYSLLRAAGPCIMRASERENSFSFRTPFYSISVTIYGMTLVKRQWRGIFSRKYSCNWRECAYSEAGRGNRK